MAIFVSNNEEFCVQMEYSTGIEYGLGSRRMSLTEFDSYELTEQNTQDDWFVGDFSDERVAEILSLGGYPLQVRSVHGIYAHETDPK